MGKVSTFINVLVPVETDLALRMISQRLQVSRSDVVRAAIIEYLKRFEDVIKVTTLPHPEGATPVPVVSVGNDSELVRIPESQPNKTYDDLDQDVIEFMRGK